MLRIFNQIEMKWLPPYCWLLGKVMVIDRQLLATVYKNQRSRRMVSVRRLLSRNSLKIYLSSVSTVLFTNHRPYSTYMPVMHPCGSEQGSILLTWITFILCEDN